MSFDHSSPNTRHRREMARRVFEEFVKARERNPNMRTREIWNKKTIITFSCELIHTLAEGLDTGHISSGKKTNVGVLHSLKYGMTWWLVRFIPHFDNLFSHWQQTIDSAIHKAALDHNFQTEFREGIELTDAELTLFWKRLERTETGTDNSKQHFCIYLLVWITAARPGSFTVCDGYERGSTTATGVIRQTDETLRWEDLEFFRFENAIAFKITFKFRKGHRDPHRAGAIDAKRTFTVLPVNGDRYHLDLAMVMTSMAFSRGVFKCSTVEELYSCKEKFIPRNEDMNSAPVFLKADNAGMLVDGVPMHEREINPKLQETCSRIGLYARHTIHSFRGTSIIEEHREDLLGEAFHSYDHLVLEDYDISNLRNKKGKMDRSDLKQLFSQAHIRRFGPEDTTTDEVASQVMDDSISDEQRHEEHEDHGRNAPSNWRQLDSTNHDTIVIQQVGQMEGEEPPTQIGRINFHKNFLGMASMQYSDLQCIQCKLDPSVSYQKKDLKYTHSELNQHLKSNFHTRREQVLRCFNIDKDDNGECRCPCCGDNSTEMYKAKAFISHMESDHRTVMKF